MARLPGTLAVTQNQLRRIEDAKIYLLRSVSAAVTLSDQNRREYYQRGIRHTCSSRNEYACNNSVTVGNEAFSM
jgi:hypothetical protein